VPGIARTVSIMVMHLVILQGLFLPQESIRDKPLRPTTNLEPVDPAGVAGSVAEARLAAAVAAAEVAKNRKKKKRKGEKTKCSY